MITRTEIVDWARPCYEDLHFSEARRWLDDVPGRKACGHLPVYAPREVILASGMLPVGIYGGGDQLEIIKGDAFYQSYICHLPRSRSSSWRNRAGSTSSRPYCFPRRATSSALSGSTLA